MRQFLCGLWGHQFKITEWVDGSGSAWCPRCERRLARFLRPGQFLPFKFIRLRDMDGYPGRYLPGPLRRFLEAADCLLRGHDEEWVERFDRDVLRPVCRRCHVSRDSAEQDPMNGHFDRIAGVWKWR